MGALPESLTEIIKSLAGTAADEVNRMLSDAHRCYRSARQRILIEKAGALIARCSGRPAEVSPKILLPLLDYVAVEDNERLLDAWAALLANAALPQEDFSVAPVFVETLKHLSPVEATFLLSLHDLIVHLHQESLPWEFSAAHAIYLGTDVDLLIRYLKLGLGRPTETREQALRNIPGDLRDFMAILDNLERQNLLLYHLDMEAPGWGTPAGIPGMDPVRIYHLTTLGYQFIRACQPPRLSAADGGLGSGKSADPY
jgi:hypothetical protein